MKDIKERVVAFAAVTGLDKSDMSALRTAIESGNVDGWRYEEFNGGPVCGIGIVMRNRGLEFDCHNDHVHSASLKLAPQTPASEATSALHEFEQLFSQCPGEKPNIHSKYINGFYALVNAALAELTLSNPEVF